MCAEKLWLARSFMQHFMQQGTRVASSHCDMPIYCLLFFCKDIHSVWKLCHTWNNIWFITQGVQMCYFSCTRGHQEMVDPPTSIGRTDQPISSRIPLWGERTNPGWSIFSLCFVLAYLGLVFISPTPFTVFQPSGFPPPDHEYVRGTENSGSSQWILSHHQMTSLQLQAPLLELESNGSKWKAGRDQCWSAESPPKDTYPTDLGAGGASRDHVKKLFGVPSLKILFPPITDGQALHPDNWLDRILFLRDRKAVSATEGYPFLTLRASLPLPSLSVLQSQRPTTAGWPFASPPPFSSGIEGLPCAFYQYGK